MFDASSRDVIAAIFRRGDRVGGRTLSKRAVTWMALLWAVLPLLVLYPLGTQWSPHLPFLSLSPLIIGDGLPVTVVLATIFARRWAAPMLHRYIVILATVAAAVLQMVIYLAAVFGALNQSPQSRWISGHLLDTALHVAAVIVVAVAFLGAPPPARAPTRLAAAERQDLQHRGRSLFETVAGYIQLLGSRRRARRSAAERPA